CAPLLHCAADVVHHDLVVESPVFKNLACLFQKMRGNCLQRLADRLARLQGRLLVHRAGGILFHRLANAAHQTGTCPVGLGNAETRKSASADWRWVDGESAAQAAATQTATPPTAPPEPPS